MDAQRIQVSGETTGSEAPNQPMYEGSEANEQEVMPQGQAEQSSEQQAFEVPDKFIQEDGTVDVEALAKSYAELEKMRSGVSEEAEQMPEDAELPEGAEGGLVSQDELQDFTQQVLQDGDISEDAYADLESRGLPRDLVEAYVAGQKALMTEQQSSLLESVGGRESYEALTAWAAENLSEAEQDAYNTAMDTNDVETVKMNIQGLFARYQQAEGRPNLIAGEVGSTGASTSFRSWAEVTKAMKDTRYRNDPAYRADVTNRLAVSNLQ